MYDSDVADDFTPPVNRAGGVMTAAVKKELERRVLKRASLDEQLEGLPLLFAGDPKTLSEPEKGSSDDELELPPSSVPKINMGQNTPPLYRDSRILLAKMYATFPSTLFR